MSIKGFHTFVSEAVLRKLLELFSNTEDQYRIQLDQ